MLSQRQHKTQNVFCIPSTTLSYFAFNANLYNIKIVQIMIIHYVLKPLRKRHVASFVLLQHLQINIIKCFHYRGNKKIKCISFLLLWKLFSLKKQHENYLIENILIETKRQIITKRNQVGFGYYQFLQNKSLQISLPIVYYAFFKYQKVIVTGKCNHILFRYKRWQFSLLFRMAQQKGKGLLRKCLIIGKK